MKFLFVVILVTIIGCNSQKASESKNLDLSSVQRTERLMGLFNDYDWYMGYNGNTLYHNSNGLSIDVYRDYIEIYVNYRHVTFLFSKEQLAKMQEKVKLTMINCQEESMKRHREKATQELDKILGK